MEARHAFHTEGLFVRTYHSTTSDWITRELQQFVEKELLARGWRQLQPPDDWGRLMDDACQGLLRVPRVPRETGPTEEAARLHLIRRRPGCLPRAPRAHGSLVEWAHTHTPYADAWRRRGGDAKTLQFFSDKQAWAQIPAEPPPDGCEWLAGSFTLDPHHEEAKMAMMLVEKVRPHVVLWGFPRGGRSEEAQRLLEARGYRTGIVRVLATEYGD